MIPKASTIFVGGAVLLATFATGVSIGWKFLGWPRGYEAGQQAFATQYEALNNVAVDTMRGKQQCVTEIDKQNGEIVRQREENRKILIEDREATKVAIDKFQQAAERAEVNTRQTQIQLTEARNEIAKIQDACVNAGVPAALFDVFNRALAPAPAE